jgi:quinol monooxygenase YgiN
MMTSKLVSVATFKIHPGKLSEFKRLVNECVVAVRAKDPGTRVYDWYLNHDETECVAIDLYDSSESIIAHIGNVGHLMRQIMKITDMNVQFLGQPSPELKKMFSIKLDSLYARHDGILE